MLRYMSCVQLSDGLLFALVHLSASVSPPARLPLTPPPPGENAQLMENRIYSCLSPKPRACGGGAENKEGFHAPNAGGRGEQMTFPPLIGGKRVVSIFCALLTSRFNYSWVFLTLTGVEEVDDQYLLF